MQNKLPQLLRAVAYKTVIETVPRPMLEGLYAKQDLFATALLRSTYSMCYVRLLRPGRWLVAVLTQIKPRIPQPLVLIHPHRLALVAAQTLNNRRLVIVGAQVQLCGRIIQKCQAK